MKSPLLDAIRKIKGKNLTIIVADSDGLGDEMDEGKSTLMADEDAEPVMDEAEEEMDEGEDNEGEEIAEKPQNPMAEQMLGRKPFSKGEGSGGADDIPDEVASKLYDEEYVDRMEKSGRKPRGLFAKAQMQLKDRFKKSED